MPFSLRRLSALAALSLLLCPASVRADEITASTLTEEQKTEKRLLFNQFVEMQLAAARKKKYAEQSRTGPLRRTFLSRISSSYGYDSNVNLDTTRRGDGFNLTSAEGVVEAELSPFGWLPSRKIGLSWYSELMSYESFEASNCNSSTVSFYTDQTLHPQWSLKGQYDINYVRYYNNNQVSYFGHKVKPTLTHYASKNFSHNIFGSYELREYVQRLSLSDAGAVRPLLRQDDVYEAGWGLRYIPDEKTFAGATAALRWNDSNDVFQDYNDYKGWKINGFLYRKLPDKFSAVAFGGYDRKEYTGRVFGTAARKQNDDFFYLGGYLYYDLTKEWQAFVSYLYKQNDSNDASMEYTGYTTSLGLNLTF